MILKMEKLILYALSENKQGILEKLMGLKCVQLITPTELRQAEGEDVSALANYDVPKTYDLESKLSEITSALNVLSEYEPKAKLFSKKTVVPLENMLDMESIDAALKNAASIRGIVSNISEVKSFQSADLFTKQMMEPWKTLDLPLNKLHTRFCKILLYSLPIETDIDGLKREAADLACHIETVSADNEQQYVAAVSLSSELELIQQLFKEKNALLVNLPEMNATAAESIAAIVKKNEQYEENQKVLLESLKEQAKDTMLLKRAYDQLSTAIAEQKAKQNILITEQSFVIVGWVAEKDKDKVNKALEGFTCYYEYRQPEKNELPPVKMKNNALVEPFEIITEMYGLPNPTTLDPNPFIAPFFFLFFGMMLSDAGYGLVLFIGGLIACRLVQKGSFANKMFRLISICGVSTILWGAIYGGWFGDVITVAGKTFFNMDITIPKLIDPLADPMTIMIVSFLFGAVHLFVGMGVKAYMLIRSGDVKSAIFDIGFWYMVLIGLGMLLLGGVAFEIGKWLAIAGAVGLILTQGRHKPNIIGKITGGVMSLYDITSYFSDILSYSRILALGLATGVIASVVNILATLTGANIIGVLLFIVIFVFGHLLNLAINALGSYVHTSRLQYVEFFGKFYEGGGKPFVPFMPNTKYHLVQTKEEK